MADGDRPPSASEPLLSSAAGGRRWFRLACPSPARSFALKTSVWSELGGAVGDLGTFIPIVLALSLSCGLDLGTTLVFTALYNALTGLLFGLPMPVQPMKSIAAVAIASSPPLPLPAIAAAGLSVAAALFLLGATGLMSTLYRLLPLPVVRGVQLSQGLSFTFSALSYIRFIQPFSNSSSSNSSNSSSEPRPWLGLDGIVLALSALLFLLLTTGAGADDDRDDSRSGSGGGGRGRGRGRRVCALIPSALIVFLLGLVLCFVRDPSVFAQIKLGPSPLRVVRITWDDFKLGFFRAAIPQLPLSILNSVIAVCKLSADLFPDRPEVSAAAVSVSVGAMNLVGCWFGAVPVCHGAGGLAGQYRFGGRSGAAVLFLAAGKLLLGLLFGASFVRILREFPVGILGVLLLFSGIELAMAARDVSGKEEAFVMLACAATSMASSGGAAMGFICGLAVFVVLRVREVDWLALVANFRIPGFGGRNGRTAPAGAAPKAEEAGPDA